MIAVISIFVLLIFRKFKLPVLSRWYPSVRHDWLGMASPLPPFLSFFGGDDDEGVSHCRFKRGRSGGRKTTPIHDSDQLIELLVHVAVLMVF